MSIHQNLNFYIRPKAYFSVFDYTLDFLDSIGYGNFERYYTSLDQSESSCFRLLARCLSNDLHKSITDYWCWNLFFYSSTWSTYLKCWGSQTKSSLTHDHHTSQDAERHNNIIGLHFLRLWNFAHWGSFGPSRRRLICRLSHQHSHQTRVHSLLKMAALLYFLFATVNIGKCGMLW